MGTGPWQVDIRPVGDKVTVCLYRGHTRTHYLSSSRRYGRIQKLIAKYQAKADRFNAKEARAKKVFDSLGLVGDE